MSEREAWRDLMAGMTDDELRDEMDWHGGSPLGFRQACADELERRRTHESRRCQPARVGREP